ncbi:MAG: VTT domain-containing protein [Rubrobacteraceae bacterium]
MRWGTVVGFLVIVALAVGVPVLGGGERLQALVEQTGAWSPLAYIAAKALATIVAPFSGVPLKAASGALFGFTEGFVYSVLGDVIGGCVCFWGARRLGRGAVERFAGTRELDRVDELAYYSGGWRAVLFGRLALPPVYNLISLAAGFTKLPFWQYLMVTTFGGVLHTGLIVVLGASVALDWKSRLAAYAGIAVLALLAMLGRRYIQRILERNL